MPVLTPAQGRSGRDGGEEGGGRCGSGKGDRGQALSGKNEQTFRKTRKGTRARVLARYSPLSLSLSLSLLTLSLPPVLTFTLIDQLRFMLDLKRPGPSHTLSPFSSIRLQKKSKSYVISKSFVIYLFVFLESR